MGRPIIKTCASGVSGFPLWFPRVMPLTDARQSRQIKETIEGLGNAILQSCACTLVMTLCCRSACLLQQQLQSYQMAEPCFSGQHSRGACFLCATRHLGWEWSVLGQGKSGKEVHGKMPWNKSKNAQLVCALVENATEDAPYKRCRALNQGAPAQGGRY